MFSQRKNKSCTNLRFKCFKKGWMFLLCYSSSQTPLDFKTFTNKTWWILYVTDTSDALFLSNPSVLCALLSRMYHRLDEISFTCCLHFRDRDWSSSPIQRIQSGGWEAINAWPAWTLVIFSFPICLLCFRTPPSFIYKGKCTLIKNSVNVPVLASRLIFCCSPFGKMFWEQSNRKLQDINTG